MFGDMINKIRRLTEEEQYPYRRDIEFVDVNEYNLAIMVLKTDGKTGVYFMYFNEFVIAQSLKPFTEEEMVEAWPHSKEDIGPVGKFNPRDNI